MEKETGIEDDFLKGVKKYQSRKMKTVVYLRWADGRFEFFRSVRCIFRHRTPEEIGVGYHTLSRKNMYRGYKNDRVTIFKSDVKH